MLAVLCSNTIKRILAASLMRTPRSLVSILLLPTAISPLLLSSFASTGVLLVAQAPAQAQSAEAVAKVAQAITVRIESATQGSGVLVKRDGKRYTVLTAWHVVSGQIPGEELDIYTPDGQRHQLEQGSIKRLGEVDLAVLTFLSSFNYKLASFGDAKSLTMGSPVFVAGFPLLTEAVNVRILRFLRGDVIANANVAIANGYQLLYSNPTLPGMSGGSVLSAQGGVVGIHGQGETDIKMSELKGVAVKTGNNQAVPITYYLSLSAPTRQISSSTLGGERLDNSIPLIPPSDLQSAVATPGVIAPVGFRNAQDALASAASLLATSDYGLTIKQTSEFLAYRQSWFAYYLRAAAEFANGINDEAFSDINQSLALRDDYASSYVLRSIILESRGQRDLACRDLVVAKSYGAQSVDRRISEKCSSVQYPTSFFNDRVTASFFAKAAAGYVNIGTTSSWDNTVTPVLVKIISVSHPLIILEQKSRMNAIWDSLQTGRVDINCAKFWLQPSADLYQDTPRSSNVLPYLYKYFCRKPV